MTTIPNPTAADFKRNAAEAYRLGLLLAEERDGEPYGLAWIRLAEHYRPYKAWYDEAMKASNEAGFVGADAASTIRELERELAAAKAEIGRLKRSLGMAIEAAEQQSWSAISVADRNQLNKDAMT